MKIHVTFLLILAWFGAMYWQQGGFVGAVQGVGFTLLLFLCVLLHEFGHAFAARAYGIRTPDITLLPIGGVARLERMPDKPVQELVVAIAGPAVNAVICLVLFAVLATKFRMSDLTEVDRLDGSLTAKLMAVNFMLVAFNAIPAFPMDGGRVLRALLAMTMNYSLATTIAARVGQVLAVVFAVASFFGPTMLLFIAVFVFLAAQQELSMVRFRAGVGNRRVADVMSAHFSAIPTGTPVAHALAIARGSRQGVFPVVDQHLRAIGIVSTDSLEEAVSKGVSSESVDSLARPVSRIPVHAPLGAVMGSLAPGVPVVVENGSGQIVGLLAVQA
ncbi:MAG: M50 family metallopeptidase [Terrimicrobiaceae bacterium]